MTLGRGKTWRGGGGGHLEGENFVCDGEVQILC